MTYRGLEFTFADTVDELRTVAEIARDYLDPATTHTISDLIESFENIRNGQEGTQYRAEIRREAPLRTEVSEGQYELVGTGSLSVRAEIATVWEVEPVGPAGSRHRIARRFRVSGLASTLATVIDMATGEAIGHWRMEIGDPRAPGCFFHTQVMGQSASPPFPSALSIPRFPGYVATFPVVIEYVVGELFQEEWDRTATVDTGAMQRWRALQTRRYAALFAWKQVATRPAAGSPWVALKRSKPAQGMLL